MIREGSHVYETIKYSKTFRWLQSNLVNSKSSGLEVLFELSVL